MLCYDLQGGELISKSLFRSQKCDSHDCERKTKTLNVMLKKTDIHERIHWDGKHSRHFR